VDILAVDVYFDMYACQYLWVRLAINVSGKSFSKKFQNSDGHIP
jgi:hypothetical protein